jgi:hypothetical protein
MCRVEWHSYSKRITDHGRIFENQHLLDATEIFRKLNVHKKVRNPMQTSLGSAIAHFAVNGART